MRRIVVFAALVAVLVAAPAQARGLRLGFYESGFDDAGGPTLVDDAANLGSTIIRITPLWAQVAPTSRPPGFNARNPADPAYRWSGVDAAVREAGRRGMQVILTFQQAPAWAEARGRPDSAPPGTWKPRPSDLANFAHAAAVRYSGRFADPLNPGQVLPRVRYWQAWNEPNLATYLTPQWVATRRGFQAASPGQYRSMLNAVYAAVKGVAKTNFVVSAGTAPYGDLAPGGRRIAPVAFMRDVFCLNRALRRTPGCSHPAHLDAISHHPYAIAGPSRHALNADDAAIPDLGKLTRVLHAAERARTVLPRGHKRVWVTEVSWDSRPPDPYGVPEATHARWLAESFESLWRQGVDTITWFQVRDQLPVPDYASTYQSGVLFADGRPKLAATAFRFPFVATRKRGQVNYWLRAPANGTLTLEAMVRGNWRQASRRRVRQGAIITGKMAYPRGTLVRGAEGDVHSLAWAP